MRVTGHVFMVGLWGGGWVGWSSKDSQVMSSWWGCETCTCACSRVGLPAPHPDPPDNISIYLYIYIYIYYLSLYI